MLYDIFLIKSVLLVVSAFAGTKRNCFTRSTPLAIRAREKDFLLLTVRHACSGGRRFLSYPPDGRQRATRPVLVRAVRGKKEVIPPAALLSSRPGARRG